LVLYDKQSNFLGIGQSELSMLGYEDIEEFKSSHSDFADLFVNHPGYISKFKNFSWIDYSLHSGVPNKNVILKHKNGTNIEAKLNIFEVFLISPLNKEDTLYNIEVDISSSKNDNISTTNINTDEKNIEPESNLEAPEPADKIVFDDLLIEDYQETGVDTDNTTVESQTVDHGPTIKLKIDMANDDSAKEVENYTQEREVSEEDIDFTQIAEDTGMDIESLAMFTAEFIKDSKDISTSLHSDNNFTTSKNKIVKLKGIASNLQMKSFVKTLDLMLENHGNSKFGNYLDIFDNKIKNLENKLF